MSDNFVPNIPSTTTNKSTSLPGYFECKFKPLSTTDAPGNKECVSVVGNIDTDNPNHFSTQAACKNDCGNSYNCIDCDCGISKGLNGSEIIATCDASCPDKTYRCDNGRCIQDVCPSAGNPGLSYADCRLQCGKYRCSGSTTTTGRVYAWGNNNDGQCNVPDAAKSGVSAIASGWQHTIALKNGAVLSWGSEQGDYYGLLNIPTAALSGVTAIAGGELHSIALKSDGSVISWGLNNNGQCGGTDVNGKPITSTIYAAPVKIDGTILTGVSAIACGGIYTVALKDGAVLAWGNNNFGQCTIPVAAQNGVSAIACGHQHTIALKDGAVLAWGNNTYGQCNVPTAALSGVTAIAGGGEHTIALKINPGTGHMGVLAWGRGDYGQCTVPPNAKAYVTAIAGGYRHTIALKDGGVLAWGSNFYGQCTIPTDAIGGVSAIAGGVEQTFALEGTVTTATKCDFYSDTDNGYDSNALCEANTTCNTGIKYQCVYTTCPNGRVLGSTCQPTTTFVAGVTYYDSFGECEASACADVVDQGNRWKCVNNDCVFINYCDGDGTYKEESGPNGCRDNCWGWNCKNNQCTSERFATNNHDNCAESCHCKWSAINITGQGTACPACIKLCGRELADARSNNVPCTDEWATTCPVAYGYYDTEAECKQFLIDNDFGEFICKENGTCERLNPAFPLETQCGKYCSKSACEASCRRASPGYECVEPPVPYSGRTTCRQITSCSGGTAPYETLEDCISGCDYIVSRGWNCRTNDSGISTCVALTSITDGIPQFTSSALCNRFCINNFGWNCKSNVCVKAWEAPGSFSSYAQCLSVCNVPDPNQGPCGNVIDSTTGSVNTGGSTSQ